MTELCAEKLILYGIVRVKHLEMSGIYMYDHASA